MHQTIQGIPMEVVEFDTMPELPITGLTESERKYKNLFRRFNPFRSLTLFELTNPDSKITCSEALTDAIERGIITEPGKYGIHIKPGTLDYLIYKIVE